MVSIRMGWLWVEGTPMRLPLRALNLRQASPNLCQPHPFALGFTLSNPQGHSLATFWVMTANRNVLTRNLSGDGEGEGEGGGPRREVRKSRFELTDLPRPCPNLALRFTAATFPLAFGPGPAQFFAGAGIASANAQFHEMMEREMGPTLADGVSRQRS